mmetsp:Transcript_26235/g.42837  ORF Transcript_26235/g.42837 Transcript_26235/m.42837 type:complete len:336 (-) Transcript_26235:1816-2823(-)
MDSLDHVCKRLVVKAVRVDCSIVNFPAVERGPVRVPLRGVLPRRRGEGGGRLRPAEEEQAIVLDGPLAQRHVRAQLALVPLLLHLGLQRQPAGAEPAVGRHVPPGILLEGPLVLLRPEQECVGAERGPQSGLQGAAARPRQRRAVRPPLGLGEQVHHVHAAQGRQVRARAAVGAVALLHAVQVLALAHLVLVVVRGVLRELRQNAPIALRRGPRRVGRRGRRCRRRLLSRAFPLGGTRTAAAAAASAAWTASSRAKAWSRSFGAMAGASASPPPLLLEADACPATNALARRSQEAKGSTSRSAARAMSRWQAAFRVASSSCFASSVVSLILGRPS